MSDPTNNLVVGTTLFGSVIGIVANLIMIGTTLGVFALGNFPKDKNWILYLLPVISLLILSYFILKIKSEICFFNLLMLVAQRGHLHTLRMLLLVRNARKGERKHLDDGNADFTFRLEKKQVNGKSTVTYHHTFKVKRKNPKTFCFSTWLFGDEGIPPEIEEARIDTQSFNMGSVMPVKISLSDFANHEGIYKFDWVISKEDRRQKPKRSDKTQFDLQYFRKDAFTWDKDDILMIYPKSFLTGIKCASFSVSANSEDSKSISEITITELSQGLIPTIKGPYQMKKQADKGSMSFYSTQGELQISEKNVYVITIHLK